MEYAPTVLLVAGDQTTRSSLRWLLRHYGIDVKTYSSVEEFLSSCDRDQPGCVILDLGLADTNWLGLYWKELERERRNPVIVLTAQGDRAVTAEAVESGAFTVIEKPFSPAVFLDRIHQAIEQDIQSRRHR
jgi:FixJ family two-component response regulator